ncbi:peptide-methionine (S)-S-oxide reductase MsrA [Halohasta salina]|uniref:peptide-methionine (S)-S-oxide reductase MsrA n=1 Tax=Halohasta salina TaxID=2961621 RepID=UPI0020A384D3|nr:peptide-methionine (S)-S-oxide reductase [Halohasta salina]
MSLTTSTIEEYDRRAPTPESTETATFALGCFWGPDGRFGALDGVVRTRVGYAGGTSPDPTYHDLGDHTEALQVDFDPEQRSFESLLNLAFHGHDHTRQPSKRQYQNIVFASTAAQADTIRSYLDARGLTREGIATRVEQLSAFHLAEASHQKHSLSGRQSLSNTFEQAGYDDADRRESPAAAKLNGYAAGRELPAGHDLGTSTNRTVY